MLISILTKINNLNELIFAPVDNLIESLPLPEWGVDAICDSVHLVPFLFFVFLVIEILEFYYADKINSALKKTGRSGVLIGALAAIFPQCGFSVIASGLYVKRIITIGTLIAVYLATSDETIPILLATPSKAYLVLPIVGFKLLIGIVMGYFIDLTLRNRRVAEENKTEGNDGIKNIIEEGCCKHDIEHGNRRELLIHPILHTINIFGFILVITLILNYCLENVGITDLINTGGEKCAAKFIQPVIAAFVGLVPNCAISIGITMMLIKGTITFGAAMSGLLSNAGLGLLVLLKNNDFKDTLRIIFILLVVSIASGLAIDFLLNY